MQLTRLWRSLTRTRGEPFTFLLYLEWILLAVALVSEAWPALLGPGSARAHLPLTQAAVVLAFALLGLWQPRRESAAAVGYIALSFALVLPAAGLGGSPFGLSSFLLLLVLIRACLVFEQPGRLAVAAVAYLGFILGSVWQLKDMHFFRPAGGLFPPPERVPVPLQVVMSLDGPPHQDMGWIVAHLTLHSALLFGAALVFVLLLVNAMLAEYAGREKLALANRRLYAYAQRVEGQAAIEERNRIARDIHDSLGHSLTALNLQMEMALALLPLSPERSHGYMTDAKRLGSEALQAVRTSVSALRSQRPLGDDLGSGLHALARGCEQAAGIRVQCDLDAPLPSLSVELATAVYRIAQEALTNVCRHAGAGQVYLELRSVASQLRLVVRDDGRGFDPALVAMGFGIAGMRERATALGARLQVESAPAEGCSITVHFPLFGGRP